MRVALITTIAALITGCATPYASSGLMGGFSETQLAPNVYQVNFRGNGFTSAERASDFALLRSADLCLDNGYRYFVVANEQVSTKLSTYTSPTTAHTTGSANVYGNAVYGQSTTTYSGGQTYLISKPGEKMLVAFYATPPNDLGIVFDAAFMDTSIRTKYKMAARDAPQ